MKIPNWIKQSFRFALKDKVYSILAVLWIIVAALDLFTSMNLTGGYCFFALVFISALLKIGYLEWKISEVDSVNFKAFRKMAEYVHENSDDFVDISGQNVIECEIETPQFRGSQNKYKMYKQTGTFYTNDMKFISSNSLNGHDVQFRSISDFKEALRKLL